MKAVASVAALLLALTACSTEGDPTGLGTPSPSAQPMTRTGEPRPEQEATEKAGPIRPRVVGTIASNLVAPWGVVFLPNGTALVSERDTTKVLAVKPDRVRTVGRLSDAAPQGEAGLLGLEISPAFKRDRFVYAYYTTESDNRVVRMKYVRGRLGDPQVVLKGIPNGYIHDGGRLEFGPDGYLYVSTGEIGEEQLAQDRDSLAGKILRITRRGAPAPGNPVEGSPVWTMGHRNVQGLAFDTKKRLWASEFGANTWDELNRIERANNYGWPLVEGKGDLAEYRNPFAQWRTSEASPSGLAFAEGSLWMASLRGNRLWRIPVKDNGTIGEPVDYFVGKYGRLRTVALAPDGRLWLTTSNRDGRGDPAESDDRILVVALR
ncbi:MAG TPA: PQQ-dependent sugar dehydrogenase [Nocardioidaceae bacterium]|nr:PQQ-dependent sugar dehydrogenase [Nocardioidaceae bacterium]